MVLASLFFLSGCLWNKNSGDSYSGSSYSSSSSSSSLPSKLTIKEINIIPVNYNIPRDTSLSITWVVDNSGCEAGKYEIKIYLSRNQELDFNDSLIGEKSSNLGEDNFIVDPSDLETFYAGSYYVILEGKCKEDTNWTFKVSTFPLRFRAYWTILVYMDGDNSLDSYTDKDLNEMIQVGSQPYVNILVERDRLYKGGERIFIKPGATELLQTLGEINMGDPQTLIDFVKWGVSNFPADHYFLILWNHGDGFYYYRGLGEVSNKMIKSICIDDEAYDALNLEELKSALSQIKQILGRKIDVIGMDACLMGMLEVAYEIKDYADYMVASENTEPGDGWPYDKSFEILKGVQDISPVDLIKNVTYGFEKEYSIYDVATLSGINLFYLDNLTYKLNQFLNNLLANSSLFQVINSQVLPYVQRFDDSNDLMIGKEDSFIDFFNFLELCKEKISDPQVIRDLDSLLNLKGLLIISSVNTGGDVVNATGISVWFPDEINSSPYDFQYQYYKTLDFANQTFWDEFLQAFLE